MTDEERILKALLPDGPPSEARRAEFFELYKLMVASSEALVKRRQAVNTFFITINGALLTAVGLVARLSGSPQLRAVPVIAIAVAGFVMSYAWWSLLRSFGQLNTGKFAIINRMERWLAASIYAAEWEALERGENPEVYRSFTSREVFVPIAALVTYGLVTIVAALIAIGVVNPT